MREREIEILELWRGEESYGGVKRELQQKNLGRKGGKKAGTRLGPLFIKKFEFFFTADITAPATAQITADITAHIPAPAKVLAAADFHASTCPTPTPLPLHP